jgi:large subunit ribosomal protein L9
LQDKKYNYTEGEKVKVVFMEDVPNVGKAGQIKEVADGYGKNYLLPRKLAVSARPQDIKAVEAQIKARARIEAKTEAEMKALAAELEGKELILKAKVGQQDRLYGSITSADIAVGLESSLHTVVDKRKIELAEPIRQTGSSEVSIKLGKDIVTKIKVTVVAEDAV